MNPTFLRLLYGNVLPGPFETQFLSRIEPEHSLLEGIKVQVQLDFKG